MKSQFIAVVTMLCAVTLPFAGASTRRVERGSFNVGVSKGAPKQTAVNTYRVVLNGFRVNRETYDTAFETDGKGDEVFILSEAGTIDGSGALGQRFSRQSKVFGDINGFPNRVQAGFRGEQGGLNTDDRFPAHRNLSQPRPTGAPIFEDRIPMVLWTGDLFEDLNVAVIMPTIWEWDLRSIEFPAPGRPIPHTVQPSSFVRDRYEAWLGGSFGQFVLRNRRTTLRTAFVGTADRTGWIRERSSADIFTMGTNGTRVIGLRNDERVYDTDVFQPKVLILTHAAAEQALRSGNGLFEVTYEEPRCCGLEGSYTLFLQLERLPPVTLGP